MLSRIFHRSAHSPAEKPPRAVEFSGLTNLGRKRSNNEDAFAGVFLAPARASQATPLPWQASGQWISGKNDSGLLLAVSDGMGGAKAGEVASRLAIEGLAARLAEAGRLPSPESRLEAARAAANAVHADIFLRAEREPGWRGMGATVCALWFAPGAPEAVMINVGDSRLYRWRDGRLEQLSRDQTVTQALIDQGKMTPEQAERANFKSTLEHALGADGQPIVPQVASVDWQAGDAFLLCSDGLHGAIGDDKIARLLPRRAGPKELSAAAERLIAAALAASGSDNITALVARA